MGQALATVTFAGVSGIPDDSVVNSFALDNFDSAASPGDLSSMTNNLVNFYNAVPPLGAFAVGSYISDAISRVANSAVIRYYDITGLLNGAPHGSPWAVANWTLVAAGGANQLPAEVALCITLEAFGRSDAAVEAPDGADSDFLIDRPKQRKTGRIYLGPLSTQASDALGTPCRPTTTFMDDCLKAIKELNTQVFLDTGSALCVWSRKDANLIDLEAVSVDDAWDIQRRRGASPTGRTRIPLP